MLEFESEPAQAVEVFGDRIEMARNYTRLLAENSQTLGLLGPRELPKIWTRHVLHSALPAELIPSGSKVADVGSGAGLPGIPLAIALPDCEFVLIEPMERRASWLQQVINQLGLTNVSVLRARAEEAQDSDFDIVTARAVAAMDKLVKIFAPLTRNSKEKTILALKGSKAAEELEVAKPRLKKLGFAEPEILTVGLGKAPETATVVRVKLKEG